MITIAAIVLTAAIDGGTCCNVAGVNARAGVALAQNRANKKTFLFTSKDSRLFSRLRPGTAVSFSRTSGLSVAGYPSGAFRLIRWPKNGRGRAVHVEIDCSKFPELCHGYKPGQNPIDYIGGTTWQDVIDFCWDSPDNCVSGPD